jgi:hypothetical protein
MFFKLMLYIYIVGSRRKKPEEQKVQKSITNNFTIIKKAKLSSNC